MAEASNTAPRTMRTLTAAFVKRCVSIAFHNTYLHTYIDNSIKIHILLFVKISIFFLLVRNSLEEESMSSRQDPQPDVFHVKYAILVMLPYATGRPSEIGAVKFSLDGGLEPDSYHCILGVGETGTLSEKQS